MATDVEVLQQAIRRADAEAAEGRYKEAYNLLGPGPWGVGGDQALRLRRGRYAYCVAHERLEEFPGSGSPKETLIKAGCWLARSEAYLGSASEGVDDAVRREVEAEATRTRREQDRFRRLAREFGEDLFVAGDGAGGADDS